MAVSFVAYLTRYSRPLPISQATCPFCCTARAPSRKTTLSELYFAPDSSRAAPRAASSLEWWRNMLHALHFPSVRGRGRRASTWTSEPASRSRASYQASPLHWRPWMQVDGIGPPPAPHSVRTSVQRWTGRKTFSTCSNTARHRARQGHSIRAIYSVTFE